MPDWQRFWHVWLGHQAVLGISLPLRDVYPGSLIKNLCCCERLRVEAVMAVCFTVPSVAFYWSGLHA